MHAMGKFTSLSVLTTASISPAIPESFVTYMKSDDFGAYLFSKSYLYLVVEIKILHIVSHWTDSSQSGNWQGAFNRGVTNEVRCVHYDLVLASPVL